MNNMRSNSSEMFRLFHWNAQAVLEGILTWLPGCSSLLWQKTGGTHDARYCYSVWLRHLVKTSPFRPNNLLGIVLELGPGDSLGTGLAALLSGAEQFIALDEVNYASPRQNQQVLKELLSLFSGREPIPSAKEFPKIHPLINDYSFPNSLLGFPIALGHTNIEKIAAALENVATTGSPVKYIRPEEAGAVIDPDSIDLIFSQAVLEHVDDLHTLYRNCYKWLRPGGLMSHQVDFKSHGTSHEWNGHWTYPPKVWRLLRGRRPYLINREPCSTHLQLLQEVGFEIFVLERNYIANKLSRTELANRFRNMDEEDLITAGAYLIAAKPK